MSKAKSEAMSKRGGLWVRTIAAVKDGEGLYASEQREREEEERSVDSHPIILHHSLDMVSLHSSTLLTIFASSLIFKSDPALSLTNSTARLKSDSMVDIGKS